MMKCHTGAGSKGLSTVFVVTVGCAQLLLTGCKTVEDLSQNLATTLSAEPSASSPVVIPSEFADLRAYYDRATACTGARKFNHRSRMLVGDSAGVVIDLDNKLMFVRYPVGMTWVGGKAVGKASAYKMESYKEPLPRVGAYFGLSGWRLPTIEEMGALYVKCNKDGAADKNLNRHDLSYMMTSTRGDTAYYCSTRPAAHVSGFIFWEDHPAIEVDGDRIPRADPLGCSSSGWSYQSRHLLPVRKLAAGEVAEYEKIFRNGIAASDKPVPSFMHFIDGSMLQGVFNAQGNGSGFAVLLKEHYFGNEYGTETADFYYGDFKNYLPDGRGAQLKRGEGRTDGIFSAGSLVSKAPSECADISTVLPAQTKQMELFGNEIYDQAWVAREYWLGGCKSGKPHGFGPVVIKYMFKQPDERPKFAFLTAMMSMVDGKPDGEFIVSGRGTHHTGFTVIDETKVAKLSKGVVAINYIDEARRQSQEAFNKALGTMVGWGMRKIAEAYEFCRKNPSSCSNPTPAAAPNAPPSTAIAPSPSGAPPTSGGTNAETPFSYKVVSEKVYAGSTNIIKITCQGYNYESSLYFKDGKYCDGVGALAYCKSSRDDVALYKCTGRMR